MPDTGAPYEIPFLDGTELVRAYPQFSEDLADQIVAGLDRGFRYAGTRYYTSSGQFEKADPLGTGDIGLRAIRVRMVGGGGGGAGAGATGSGQVSGGGGGGGGGYAEKFITDIASLDASETVTRGAGGSGGSGNTSGNAGGDSVAFGVTANGGAGGGAGQSGTPVTSFGTGGAGGLFDGGDFGFRGSGGQSFFAQSTSRIYQASGGSSAFGLNDIAAHNVTTTSQIGLAAGGFGSAGGSAVNAPSDSTVRDGASGRFGIVIVDCFV